MPGRARVWLMLVILAAAGAGGIVAAAARVARVSPEAQMAAAAGKFIESLSPELRAKAVMAFEDKAREDWHFVPRKSAGVEFGEMTAAQKMAARDLMRSALSSRGMNTVEEIMLLDAVLRELENGRGPRRDPLGYAIAIFGTPGAGPWGWKLEGHHISLNFTGVRDAAAVTPAFLGANPAEIRTGERAGVRVLAAVEDVARELLATLTPEQRNEAIIGKRAPRDILAVPGRSLAEIDSVGLAAASMDAVQRALVDRLLREYAENLRHELAENELARINAAGIEKVRFAWMGSDRRGEGHYYRLSGPTFVIEYDNTQDGANHIHTVWRDRERDFGHDLLREHLEHGHDQGHEKK